MSEVREMHGIAERVWLWEGANSIAIKTIGVERLTAEEARHIARKLHRLARRLDEQVPA